jgi:hypothetical protein
VSTNERRNNNPDVTVEDEFGVAGCRNDGATQLGPATAVSWLLENKEPGGTEIVESTSVVGSPPVIWQGSTPLLEFWVSSYDSRKHYM